MTAQRLLDRLEKVTGKFPRWRARCPSCGSKNGTKLSVCETDDQRVLIKCFGGCPIEQIVGAVGLDLADLFSPKTDKHFVGQVRRPWSSREVVDCFRRELMVAAIFVADIAAGRPSFDQADRDRASLLLDRLGALHEELFHAR